VTVYNDPILVFRYKSEVERRTANKPGKRRERRRNKAVQNAGNEVGVEGAPLCTRVGTQKPVTGFFLLFIKYDIN
jgi:hypothetical protein